MRTGVIDIGTNTFHLLIADPQASSILHDEKIAVRIGRGGISKGLITDDAIERAIRALSDFKQTLDELKVNRVYTTATSAVRNASNQSEFIHIVKERTDLDINVLSGEEEAFLIHQGVRQFVDFGKKTGLIVDIGGGSIEFIIADNDEVKWLKSFEIGGQRLIDQFHKSDPITAKEIETLEHFLEQTLWEVFAKCREHSAEHLIGSSGSFDTFWDIFRNKNNINAPIELVLNYQNFESIHNELIAKDKNQRLLIPGMIPMRVEMIVGASIVTKNILDHCGFDLIKISPFALKEGVLSYGLPNRN